MTNRAWTLLFLCLGLGLDAALWRADNTDLPAGYTGCIDICGDRDIIPINDPAAMAESHPGEADGDSVK